MVKRDGSSTSGGVDVAHWVPSSNQLPLGGGSLRGLIGGSTKRRKIVKNKDKVSVRADLGDRQEYLTGMQYVICAPPSPTDKTLIGLIGGQSVSQGCTTTSLHSTTTP
jgi:hypothetical protein